ncbi:hypothetical protein [Streptomyces sp. NPDC059176]|uniref:hypothetical protein n=1 Tax=unclassified Streptomyces TaxID=2593676 RepID=UPI00369A26DE
MTMPLTEPSTVDGNGPAPLGAPVLRVVRGVHRRFDGGATRPDGNDTTYLRDQAAQAGVAFRPDLIEGRTGNSFGDMAVELLADFGDDLGPVELLALAYATPDVSPVSLTAPLVADRIPGRPMVLAITDQGRTAPFTMLSVTRGAMRRHGFRRALVMAFDQALLPYETPSSGPHHLAGDGAAALLLETAPDVTASEGYEVHQVSGVEPAEARRGFAELAAGLLPERGGHLLLGPGVGDDWWSPAYATSVLRFPHGYPCTALLGGLADALERTRSDPVVLADHDTETGDLSVCRVGGATA